MLDRALRLDDGGRGQRVAAPAASAPVFRNLRRVTSDCVLLLIVSSSLIRFLRQYLVCGWYTTAGRGQEMGNSGASTAASDAMPGHGRARVTVSRQRPTGTRSIPDLGTSAAAGLFQSADAEGLSVGLLEHLVAALADDGQDGDHDQHQATQPAGLPLSGRSMKVMKLPREITSAWRSFSSISRPSTKPSSSGAGSKPNLTSA